MLHLETVIIAFAWKILKLYNWHEGKAINRRKQAKALNAGTSMKGKVEVQALACSLEHSRREFEE